VIAGRNGKNAGMVGVGSTSDYVDEPTLVNTDTDVSVLLFSCGGYHCCGVFANVTTNAEQLQCWGTQSPSPTISQEG
jgi:hypothetical protein